MASLKRIEELTIELDGKRPHWTEGINSPIVSKLDLSGQLREYAESTLVDRGSTLFGLLFSAAEALDDAHEEWLSNRLKELQK